jgi:uncharacterized protein HemX
LYLDEDEIPATYELHPEKKAQDVKHADAAKTALVIAGIVAALSAAIVGILYANNVNNSQATQIRALNSANTRLAGELSAQSNQLARISARLAAVQSAANDPILITCTDLRHMNLMATDSAGIEAGGSIGLNQSPVPLPPHCPKN